MNFFPARRITPAELKLIPTALWQLLIARLKVSLLPSKTWMNSLNRQSSQPSVNDHKNPDHAFMLTLPKAINGLSRRTPWQSTCLVKALAANRILAKRGIKSHLHLGVKRSKTQGIEAHAWLTVGSKVILGGENLDNYMEIKGF
jgi:hypothetical protein